MDMIKQAREWLLDCISSFANVEDEEQIIAELSDIQVMRAVERTYDGGWRQFLRDSRCWQ